MKSTVMVKRFALLSCTWLMLASISCKKENQSGVPYVPVDITINVNLPEHNALAVPGGWENITGGSRGILIYRSSTTDFVAFDRHCPYQSEQLCAITMDSTYVTATDTECCNTTYLVLDGSVTQGVGTLPLHAYSTTFNGTLLRIYN